MSVRRLADDAVLIAQIHDDDPVQSTDLRRSQADARCVVHGVQHVIHQGADSIVHSHNGLGDLLQDRQIGGVINGEDATNSHEREVSPPHEKVKISDLHGQVCRAPMA